MGNVLERGELFTAKLTNDIFSKVKGKSVLAKLSGQDPIPFNGIKEFTFSMDKEIDIVAESGAKSNGGATLAPITIVPIKVEYGARVSDEFMYASEEEALNILAAWTEGFAKKLARGIDLMAIHGVNPRTGEASLIIGSNNFDAATAEAVVTYDSSTPDANLESAIAIIEGNEYEATGIALAPAMRAAMGAMKTEGGAVLYPGFQFGGVNDLNGVSVEPNVTVSANSSPDRAIVGNFQDCFKWGIAKQLPLEVIEYGNPDNDAEAGDLKGHNQIYLRSEAYVGWGILDKNAFARVAASVPSV